MFMSRRAFLWFQIIALCSGDERGKKMVDRVTKGAVPLEGGEKRLFH